MPDHPTTSAERLRSHELPGRADADIAPSRERYYPLDRPLPGALEPTVDELMARPVASYAVVRKMDDHDLPALRATLRPQEPATALPTSALARKELPMATGLLDYFPAALVAVAALSRVGNEQHNPGKPLHWDRSKSGDEADALLRHFVERGTFDTDGLRHSVKVAWRALALLQKELEAEGLAPLSRGSR